MGKRNLGAVVGTILVVVLLLLIIRGLLPLSYAVCPAWEVTVVDAAGAPVSGMRVRRSCQDYSVEGSNHEDDATTDEGGKASFKGKYLRWPLFLRWAGNVLNVASQGVHASFGRYSYVSVFGRGMEGDPVTNDGHVEVWTGSPEHMESRIVVKPVTFPLPR